MRILHVCLSCYYIDHYAYQENILPRVHKEQGNEVYILSSCETFVDNQKLGYVNPSEYLNEDGIQVTRIPYIKAVPLAISRKLRVYVGVRKYLERIKPDVVFIHSTQFGSITEIINYRKQNPHVRVYADTHTASYNSGMNWFSLHVLHRVYYKWLIKRAIPYLNKFYYIGESERDFAVKNYGVPESLMEFFPLGGTIFSDEEYGRIRQEMRGKLKISEEMRLYGHAGKLTKLKKTEDLLEAFSSVSDPNARLIIMGSIPEDRKSLLMPMIQADKRVNYLGWVDGETLQKYLCACDLYCQPYDNSSIFQNAICCRCAVMTYPHPYYTELYDNGNIIWEKNTEDMKAAFLQITDGRIELEKLQNASKDFAEEYLDYRKLAARIYERTN